MKQTHQAVLVTYLRLTQPPVDSVSPVQYNAFLGRSGTNAIFQ